MAWGNKKQDSSIMCSFVAKCINNGRECDHCKWNGAIQLDNCLVLKDSNGSNIKYLEKELNGSR